MKDEEIDAKAIHWLRNYHGSIDSTALMLAFKAGRDGGLEEAAEEANGTAADSGNLNAYCNKIVRRIRALKSGSVEG